MLVTGYDGFLFTDLTLEGDLEVGGTDAWQINQSIVNRGAGTPLFGTSQPSPRTIDVTFVYAGSDPYTQFATLLGRLRPNDQGDTRKLYATRPGGVTVWRYARISLPHGWPQDDSTNIAIVQFISEDARWFSTTTTTIDPYSPTWTHGGHIQPGKNTGAIALPNSGLADVQPVITIGDSVAAENTTNGSTNGWAIRRDFTVTNNLTRPVRNYVPMLNMGDTKTLVTFGSMLSSGDDVRIIGPNGLEVPRDLVAFNTLLSFAYFYIAEIQPGEVQTYQLIYSNPSAGSPDTLVYPYHPAYLTDWYQTSTTLAAVDAAKLWVEITGDVFSGRDNKFKDGALYFQSGANAGSGKRIATHTYNTPTAGRTRITFTSAATSALATTDDVLVIASRNGIWMYDVQTAVERGSDAARGRWYLSSGESVPDIVDYTVPGAWSPYLFQDGRDKKGQPRYSREWSGTDYDSYSSLNAQRSWENGGPVAEEGIADGVSISLPFPIIDYQWSGYLLNSLGMAKGYIGVRGAGGNDWSELETLDTTGILTAWAPSLTFPSGRTITQIYQGLLPYEGDYIDGSWARDSGSSTGVGTTTTLTDSLQGWRTNQWVAGVLKLTGGRRSGQRYTVTANTGSTITFTPATGTAIKSDQPYELTMGKGIARLVDDARCTLTYDDSGIVISALDSERVILDESARLWLGGGKSSSAVLTGYRRNAVDIGKSGDYFVTRKDGALEYIQLDGSRRSATMYNSSDAVVTRLVDPRVRWRYTDELGTERASGNGMPIPPGVNVLVNPGFETGITNWTRSDSGVITDTFQQDSAYYVKQESGTKSAKLNVTSSTGPAFAQITADDRIACLPGDLCQFAAFVFTENANIKPFLGIRFYTSALATVSNDWQSDATYSTGIWYAEGFASVAPATAAYWAPFIRADVASGSRTGSIFIDDVNVGSPILFYQSDHKYTSAFTVVYTPAYWL